MTDRSRRALRNAALLVGGLLALAAVSDALIGGPPETSAPEADAPEADPAAVSRSAFEAEGLAWPLAVDAGRVGCEDGLFAFFEEPDGTRWALTGAAQSLYPEVDPVWLENPEVKGARVSLYDLTSRALARCG